MTKPEIVWSSEDMEAAITSESLSIGDYMVGGMAERRRLLDALHAGDWPEHVKREFGIIIAKGRQA